MFEFVAIFAGALALVALAWLLAYRAGVADVHRMAERRQAEFLAWQRSLTPEEWQAWRSEGLEWDAVSAAKTRADLDRI